MHYWLSHAHASTAAVAGCIVHGWWGCEALLCIVFHSDMVFYALEARHHAPFERVASVPLRARILAADVASAPSGSDTLYILTDHPIPRLLAFAPRDAYDVHTQHIWSLDEPSRPPAELGVTLSVERASGRSPGRWVLAHTHTGVLHVAKCGTPAVFHARLPHAFLIASAILDRSSSDAPCLWACLSVSTAYDSAGLPVLSFHAVDAAKHALRNVFWHSAPSATSHSRKMRRVETHEGMHVPIPKHDAYSAHYLVALPLCVGGGVALFCEHSVFFVPRPQEGKRKHKERASGSIQRLALEQPVQIAAAVCFPADESGERVRVLCSTREGAVMMLHVSTTTASDTVRMHIVPLGEGPVPAGPQSLAYLGEGFVFVASGTGDSLLWHVSTRLHEVYRWPSAAPIVDFVCEKASKARRIITGSGAGATCSVRAMMHCAQSHTVLDKPMDVVDVYLVGQPPTLVLGHPTHTTILGVRDDALVPVDRLKERVVHAASLQDGFVVATPKGLWTYGRQRSVWTSPVEILACTVHADGYIVLGLSSQALALLHRDRTEGGWSIVRSVETSALVSCLHAADTLVVGLWDCGLCKYALPSLELVERHVCSTLPTSVLEHKFTHRATHVVVGHVDGHVDIYDERHVRQCSQSLGPKPVRLVPVPLAACGMHDTVGVIAYGKCAYIIYPRETTFHGSMWPIYHLSGMACIDTQPLTMACAMSHGLSIHIVDALECLDMQTKALGVHQPTSLASTGEHVVCTTWPMLHEEMLVAGTLRVLRSSSLDELAAYDLLKCERPSSVCTAVLHGTTYIIVGTGFHTGGRTSPSSGRLLGFSWSGHVLELAWSCDVPGQVCAVASVPGYVAAAVDSQVHTYALEGSGVVLRDRWGCAFLASCLAADASTLIVGDAMHSLTVLDVADDGRLQERARDVDPYWTTTVGVMDSVHQQYVGTDIAMNMFVAERVRNASETEPWSHVMRYVTAFHYGDMVNAMARTPGGIMFATASGSFGSLFHVADDVAEPLVCLQEAIIEHVKAPGQLSWTAWRTFRTETRTIPPRHLLDASVLRQFLTSSERAHLLRAARDVALGRGWSTESITEERLVHTLRTLP